MPQIAHDITPTLYRQAMIHCRRHGLTPSLWLAKLIEFSLMHPDVDVPLQYGRPRSTAITARNAKIINELGTGQSIEQVAERYGISRASVYKIYREHPKSPKSSYYQAYDRLAGDMTREQFENFISPNPGTV